MLIFFLFSCSSLTFENRRKKNARHTLSHGPYFLLTFLFKMTRQCQSIGVLSFFLFFLACFFMCIFESSFVLLVEYAGAFFRTHKTREDEEKKKKKKGRCGKIWVLSSFLISCVNFHCVQENEEEKERRH
jgi:hypothetical protein